MNIIYLKYAVEVEKTGSISKAADALFMGQPNLSRAIKELEDSLGIMIFNRTSKGMTPTPDGAEFLADAKKTLSQIDKMEEKYSREHKNKQRFSVSVPRASYISRAFTAFAEKLETANPSEIYYKEASGAEAIQDVLSTDYKLGIIRYQKTFDKYFKSMLDEKDLAYELITEFCYLLVMSGESPLAARSEISLEDLAGYIEIAHADPYVPAMTLVDVKKAELSEFVNKRIFVFDRGSQFDLLCHTPMTFMWVSPIPSELLERYALVQRVCKNNTKMYKDVLIHRKDYHLSALDRLFITEVIASKRKYIEP